MSWEAIPDGVGLSAKKRPASMGRQMQPSPLISGPPILESPRMAPKLKPAEITQPDPCRPMFTFVHAGPIHAGKRTSIVTTPDCHNRGLGVVSEAC